LICSCDLFFIEPFCAILISKFTHAIAVFDIAGYDWFDSPIRKGIAKTMLQRANARISTTHSMEVLLRIGGLSSFCIPDLPDPAFCPGSPGTRSAVSEVFGIDNTALLIGVFMEPFRPGYFSELASHISCNVVFFVFASSKDATTLERQLSEMNTSSVRFLYVPRQYDVYPSVLGSCCLGICWNGSPAVVNIAKEVLEMQACGVPIAAFRYGCVSERVRPDSNGFLFETDHELKDIVMRVIAQSGRIGDTSQTDLRKEWRQCWRSAFGEILGLPLG
jgi:hypothetical protein